MIYLSMIYLVVRPVCPLPFRTAPSFRGQIYVEFELTYFYGENG